MHVTIHTLCICFAQVITLINDAQLCEKDEKVACLQQVSEGSLSLVPRRLPMRWRGVAIS